MGCGTTGDVSYCLDMKSRQQVLGYPVDVVDEAQAVCAVEAAWQSGRAMHVVTLNAEMVVAAQSDRELDRIVRRANLVVPDGAGVVWAVRLSGHPIKRLPGIELSLAVLAAAGRLGYPVALLGGRPEVVETAAQRLTEQIPGLNICTYRDGYFKAEEAEQVIAAIAARQPKLVLVALGVPAQEYFIDRWSGCLPGAVLIGVGGSFDVWAGLVRRAPRWMQRMHLEWLYRLFREPWRWRRMAAALPWFAAQVVRARLLHSARDPDNKGSSSS
jgi:N-acetylglucosaminyldiphosphoundecaprenol N-acetyl-beta-D-mannosaminyltransferase